MHDRNVGALLTPTRTARLNPRSTGSCPASLGGAWLPFLFPSDGITTTTKCPGLATEALTFTISVSLSDYPLYADLSQTHLAIPSICYENHCMSCVQLTHIICNNAMHLSQCSCLVNNRVLSPKFSLFYCTLLILMDNVLQYVTSLVTRNSDMTN